MWKEAFGHQSGARSRYGSPDKCRPEPGAAVEALPAIPQIAAVRFLKTCPKRTPPNRLRHSQHKSAEAGGPRPREHYRY